MVATPGDPAKGIPSDPTNGAYIADLPAVPIDIAYGGSCTAGKEVDLDLYAQVMREALAAGRRVKDGVDFFIQFGSAGRGGVRAPPRLRRHLREDGREGDPSRAAAPASAAGPASPPAPDQVTVSAINRNYQNRSGPGKLYLASPLTVAASAVAGRIVAYRQGMFAAP